MAENSTNEFACSPKFQQTAAIAENSNDGRSDGPSPERQHHLVESKDVRPGKSLQLKPTESPHYHPTDFCTFVESMSDKQLVCFFRQVVHEIEETRRILDFHMKIKDIKSGFVVEIFYGDHREGPQQIDIDSSCISCREDVSLFPDAVDGGVSAGECVLKEFSDQPYVRCSLDAKARPGFIVTPVRHVERLGELEDRELYLLWSVCVRALRSEGLPFVSMILNHGTYRNLPHLHLKVWVDAHLHQRARSVWSDDRKQVWARLERLADGLPKKRALCVFFGKQRKCRYGERCRFLHEMSS